MSKGSKWSKSNRTGRYSGAFVGRLGEMLSSPAHRVLSLAARRILDRLEIELINHGGHENGRLIVTFRQFREHGVHAEGIAAGIREAEALGFIETTERGCAGNADSRKASMYRLTYRPAEGAPADGSHEWRRVKTIEEALHIQNEARKPPRANTIRRGGKRVKKNKTPVRDSVSRLGTESVSISARIPCHEPRKFHGTESVSLYRSGSGPSAAGRVAQPASKPPTAAAATAGPATAASQPLDEAEPDTWTPTPP